MLSRAKHPPKEDYKCVEVGRVKVYINTWHSIKSKLNTSTVWCVYSDQRERVWSNTATFLVQ
jgi:hypothetical protein